MLGFCSFFIAGSDVTGFWEVAGTLGFVAEPWEGVTGVGLEVEEFPFPPPPPQETTKIKLKIVNIFFVLFFFIFSP